jgi:pimeloyl-ACP methyl ester carboxylesterase
VDQATAARAAVSGKEHWTKKGEVKLFLWQKPQASSGPKRGTVLFVHGSSMASQPTFDLKVPGRPDSSVMDWFAARGFDTWCMDHEGYGRSDKSRPINCDIPNGADDLAAGTDYILGTTGAKKLLVYGISSGALRAACSRSVTPARRAPPWTPSSGQVRATTLAERGKLPSSPPEPPPDRPRFVHSIFGATTWTADKATIEACRPDRGASTTRCRRALRRHVLRCRSSTLKMRAHHHLARPVGRHRGRRRPGRVLQAAADPDKQFSVMAGICTRASSRRIT